MNSNYSALVTGKQQQSGQQSFQPGSESQQTNEPTSLFAQVEQVRGRLADSIGATAEAAKATGIPEPAAHEIVSRAYRQSW